MDENPRARLRAHLLDPRRRGQPVPDEQRSGLRASVFDSLAEAEREQVAAHCHWFDYPSGAPILQRTDEDDDVLFIQRGQVRVSDFTADGHVVILGDLGAGESVGDFAAIDGHPRSADVFALVPTRVARMPAEDFVGCLMTHPDCMLAELRKLTGTLRQVAARLAAV